MQLMTKTVRADYKGRSIVCEKTVYGCDHCDFELFHDWMKKKYHQDLEKAYQMATKATPRKQ